MDLREEIARLKEERDAVILAHNYQIGDLQDLADFVGDSLYLSRQARDSPRKTIVFAGVRFMAETAKILSPQKTVLLPDLEAGCSLADAITADQLRTWKAEHPGGQHEINSLHVPAGRAVQLTLISQDVFHSFSIPAFRVKREAIPGRYTSVWFEATTPGTYHLFCTQYCGTDHSHMIGDVVVLTPDDYKKWLASSTSGASLAQNGERLFASLSCAACHNTRPDARGPSLANVYGSKLRLTSGQTVIADDAYLRDAILNPSQHITQGYAPIMPTYQGQISEEGVIALVEYIKNLDSDYRVQQTTTTTDLLPQSEGKAAPAGQNAAGKDPAGQGMVKQ